MITVPIERLSTDILKSWLLFFKNNSSLSWLTVRNNHPDTTVDFEYPIMVVKRVWAEKLELVRNSGFYWERFDISWDIVKRKKGYRYSSLYQIDLYEKDIVSLNNRVWKIYDMLRWGDVFATEPSLKRTSIRLKDFVSPTSTWTDTDLYIQFSFPRDVEWVELTWFDNAVYQYSISIWFRLDYVNEHDSNPIKSFNSQVTINQG